jgi:hypothetical protein
LLNQAVVGYGNQNFTGAVELAQIAYLDNYEFLEAPLGQLDPALMKATEIMISELQQLVNTVGGNLITAQQLFVHFLEYSLRSNYCLWE